MVYVHRPLGTGQELPELRTLVGGPESHSWLVKMQRVAAPMGPRPQPGRRRLGVVFARGEGCNLWDVDGNRYVDLAAGFGALLLGHQHPYVTRAMQLQCNRLMQAMGDVYPSDAKIGLLNQLTELYPGGPAQGILGQSGADAVSAALKTAQLYTGRPGVIAFHGAYHGLSYGPLSVCGLRESYRAPFLEQLNPHVEFVSYPTCAAELQASLQTIEGWLQTGRFGAVLVEPILGRGGVRVPQAGFLPELRKLTARHGALLVLDEIWTGLGRSGAWLASSEALGSASNVSAHEFADLVCLGKGLGGGLPISACIGHRNLMQAWSQEREVVHTSTFAGAPLACAAAVATLDALGRGGLVERAARVGSQYLTGLCEQLSSYDVEVRGRGLMVGIDLGARPGAAAIVCEQLLREGFVFSTGGGGRECVIATPALIIEPYLLEASIEPLRRVIEQVLALREYVTGGR